LQNIPTYGLRYVRMYFTYVLKVAIVSCWTYCCFYIYRICLYVLCCIMCNKLMMMMTMTMMITL